MKISKEVKTAVLVILGIVFLIYGINYLKGINLFESSNNFYTEFDYNALTDASPVTIKGNTVGKIMETKYDFNTGKTRVSFTVDKKLKFSKNSKVRLYETGLMGGNALAIIPAEDGAEFAEDGDKLASDVETGLINSLTNNFSTLSSDLDTTLKSADTLMVNLNSLLEDDSEKGLKHAIAELNQTLSSFKTLSNSANKLVVQNQEGLTSVIKNFDSISADLAVLSEELKSAQISKTINDLDETLLTVNGLLQDLENGEGSLGLLLKDEKLYNNLEVATHQLKELLQDFKLNPSRYVKVSVFGGKNKEEFTKPEDERQ